jgi:hypothetical protein
MAGPLAAMIIGLGNSMKVLKTDALFFTIRPCRTFGFIGFRVLLRLTPEPKTPDNAVLIGLGTYFPQF